MSRAHDLCSHTGPCAQKGPTLGFMLVLYPLKILNNFCPRCPAFSFCTSLAIVRVCPWGLVRLRNWGIRFWTLSYPAAAQHSPFFPALNFASRARIFKSGKRAREKLVMRTVFSHPLLPSLSLSLKNRKKKNPHFIVILRLECGKGHLAMWWSCWLAGRG